MKKAKFLFVAGTCGLLIFALPAFAQTIPPNPDTTAVEYDPNAKISTVTDNHDGTFTITVTQDGATSRKTITDSEFTWSNGTPPANTASGDSVSTVTDNHDGTYTITVTKGGTTARSTVTDSEFSSSGGVSAGGNSGGNNAVDLGGGSQNTPPVDTSSGIQTFGPSASTNTGGGGLVQCGTGSVGSFTECGFADLISLVNRIINFISITISVPIATIMFTWAGILYLTAAGDEKKIKNAHRIFKYVLIGLVLIFGAWLVIHTLLSLLFTSDFVVI